MMANDTIPFVFFVIFRDMCFLKKGRIHHV